MITSKHRNTHTPKSRMLILDQHRFLLTIPHKQRHSDTCRAAREYDTPTHATRENLCGARAAKLLSFMKESSVYLTALVSLLNSDSSLDPALPPVAINHSSLLDLLCNHFFFAHWTRWACLVPVIVKSMRGQFSSKRVNISMFGHVSY